MKGKRNRRAYILAYYAPYNGAIEHTQGRLNRYLKDWSWKAESPDGNTLLTELS